MTIKIQEPNILDKILGLFGKKRGFVLPKENPYEKYGPYVTFSVPRENFFNALFRSSADDLPEGIFDDIKALEVQLKKK